MQTTADVGSLPSKPLHRHPGQRPRSNSADHPDKRWRPHNRKYRRLAASKPLHRTPYSNLQNLQALSRQALARNAGNSDHSSAHRRLCGVCYSRGHQRPAAGRCAAGVVAAVRAAAR